MKTKTQVPSVMLSHLEKTQTQISPSTQSPQTSINFEIEVNKFKKIARNDSLDEFIQSFADIKELNENDAEIRRLQQENSFLNKVMNTLFPVKIAEEKSNYFTSDIPNNTPSTTVDYPEYVKEQTIPKSNYIILDIAPVIPLSTPSTPVRYPQYMTRPPTIINLQKHKLGKFVDMELPRKQKVSQKTAN